MNPAPTTPTAAGTAPTTHWRQGAGAGAAVGTAMGTCLALGTAATVWLRADAPPNYAVPVGILLVVAAIGAVCGSVIGWAVPVTEGKADATAHH